MANGQWSRASAAVLLAVATLSAPAVARAQSAGATGIGDPYFPLAGNGGYDVDRYDLRLDFKPERGRLRATAAIDATSTQALSSFNLDLRGLRVSAVGVNGLPAGFRQRGAELTVTPAATIAAGERFQVIVAYGGRPHPIGDHGTPTGWIPTHDGAFVANEPRGAITWFPCNDHPSDKASYSFTVTVPRGRTAVANGSLGSISRNRRKITFTWHETEPMATYLATVTTGRFRLDPSSAGGIPAWTAVAPGQGRRSRPALRLTTAVLGRFASYFGAYPFSSTGAIVDSSFPGVALETQTRPLYGKAPKPIILVHELAHQWFGDAVSIARWSDIWLNEGFATWTEWLWKTGGRDRGLRRIFRHYYKLPPRYGRRIWSVAPGAPGPKKLFSLSVYNRGGLTLEALRQLVGDTAFYAILRRWVSDHLYGNASTQDFIALAEAESGRQLDRFFDIWLFQRRKPRDWQ